MRTAAVGVSRAFELSSAVEEAAAAVLAEMGGCAPEAALVAISTAHGRLSPEAADRISDTLGASGPVVGLHAEGLIAKGVEITGQPAVAVLALSGFEARATVLEPPRGHEPELGEQVEADLGPLCERDLVLLVCDAHGLDPLALATGLGACAPATVLGLGVEGPHGAPAEVLAGGQVLSGGTLALRLRAPQAIAARTAPGLRGLEGRSVTRARGHWLLSIDGEPALDAFRAVAGSALCNELRRATRSVYVFAGSGDGPIDPACARAVVGFDEQAGAIGLSQPVETGDRIAFAHRDSLAAREQLAAACEGLASLSPSRPGLPGLATSCRTRGQALFGQEGLESGYLARAFSGTPWLGLIGSFQMLAAPGAPPRLLNQSGVLARLL